MLLSVLPGGGRMGRSSWGVEGERKKASAWCFGWRGRSKERGWMCMDARVGSGWQLCVCVWEPSLPPSTVKSSGCQAYSRLLVLPLSLSVPPSLPWQCHFVSTHMLVCSRVGVVGLGWRRHRHMGSLRLFPVAVDTWLLACVPLLTVFPLTPSAPSRPRSPLWAAEFRFTLRGLLLKHDFLSLLVSFYLMLQCTLWPL